jgi:YVTN family beta-propeller protein
VLILGAFVAAPKLDASQPALPHRFRMESQWNVGGAGGWGSFALDPAAHRLFIPRTNRVMVVDTQSGKMVGEVDGLKNLRGVVLDSSGRYGYATDPTDGTAGFVRVFYRAKLKLVSSIPTGLVPAAIAFDPSTKLVFAFNAHSHSATVVDSASNQVISTIPLSGRPGSAVVDGKGGVFVTLPALGVIEKIDAAAGKVSASWSTVPCTGPSGLAIDAADRQLFTTCEDHKLVAIDADTGRMTAIETAPVGFGDIDFNPRDGCLFLADSAGMLTIYHRDSASRFSVIQQIATQPGARSMIVSHDQERIYLVISKFGQNTAAVSEELRFRPTPVPGTFSVLVLGRDN